MWKPLDIPDVATKIDNFYKELVAIKNELVAVRRLLERQLELDEKAS